MPSGCHPRPGPLNASVIIWSGRGTELGWSRTGGDPPAHLLNGKQTDTVIQATILSEKLSSCAHQSSAKRTVNELLHADTTDRTRSDEENSSLCRSFSDRFLSRINDLKPSIRAKLPPPPFFRILCTLVLFRNVPAVSATKYRPVTRACLDQLLIAIRSLLIVCDHMRSKEMLIAINRPIAISLHY